MKVFFWKMIFLFISGVFFKVPAVQPTNGSTIQPRMGLDQRLQLMELELQNLRQRNGTFWKKVMEKIRENDLKPFHL